MPTIQNKRGTSSGLSSANPLLLDGEIIIESDTNKLKVGNGVYYWNELNYLNANTSGINIVNSSGNFTSLTLNGTVVSVSGHTHTSSNITNFNSSVSGLLPVGTANYLSKFGTGGSGLSNSLIFDNETNIGIGTTIPSGRLHIDNTSSNVGILLSNGGNVIRTFIGVGNSDTLPFLASTNNIQLASGNNGDRKSVV